MVTFAPSVSSMLSASRGFLGQICSAAGPSAFADATSAPGVPDTPSGTHPYAHCPYCALHADLAPPPSPSLCGAGMVLAFREFPPAFLQAPRASAVWSTAQPRAPPFLA